MDNKEIEKTLCEVNCELFNTELATETAKKAITFVRNNGLDNVVIAYEELAELEQVITKEIRGKGNRLAAIEEIADVLLGMNFLKVVYDLDLDLDKKYSILEDISLFSILEQLSNLQQCILSHISIDLFLAATDVEKIAIRHEFTTCCVEVFHAIESLKQYFSISDMEIDSLRYYKIERLNKRMDDKTLI